MPAPGEGEYVDLNTTDSCCSLGGQGALLQAGGGPGGGVGGDNAQFCDNMVIANRTLIVRRRQSWETEQSVIMHSSDADQDVVSWWTHSLSAGSGRSHATLIIIMLSQLIFIFSKFYS